MLIFPGFVFVYIGCGGWDGVWGEGMGLGRQAGKAGFAYTVTGIHILISIFGFELTCLYHPTWMTFDPSSPRALFGITR